MVENPYDNKSKKKAHACRTSTISYNIRDTTPALSGIGGATVAFDTRMEDITPLQLPTQMPESSSDESEDDISIQEEPNRTERGVVEWPEVPPDFDIYVREEMRAVEREEEEKRRKTRGGKRK